MHHIARNQYRWILLPLVMTFSFSCAELPVKSKGGQESADLNTLTGPAGAPSGEDKKSRAKVSSALTSARRGFEDLSAELGMPVYDVGVQYVLGKPIEQDSQLSTLLRGYDLLDFSNQTYLPKRYDIENAIFDSRDMKLEGRYVSGVVFCYINVNTATPRLSLQEIRIKYDNGDVHVIGARSYSPTINQCRTLSLATDERLTGVRLFYNSPFLETRELLSLKVTTSKNNSLSVPSAESGAHQNSENQVFSEGLSDQEVLGFAGSFEFKEHAGETISEIRNLSVLTKVPQPLPLARGVQVPMALTATIAALPEIRPPTIKQEQRILKSVIVCKSIGNPVLTGISFTYQTGTEISFGRIDARASSGCQTLNLDETKNEVINLTEIQGTTLFVSGLKLITSLGNSIAVGMLETPQQLPGAGTLQLQVEKSNEVVVGFYVRGNQTPNRSFGMILSIQLAHNPKELEASSLMPPMPLEGANLTAANNYFRNWCGSNQSANLTKITQDLLTGIQKMTTAHNAVSQILTDYRCAVPVENQVQPGDCLVSIHNAPWGNGQALVGRSFPWAFCQRRADSALSVWETRFEDVHNAWNAGLGATTDVTNHLNNGSLGSLGTVLYNAMVDAVREFDRFVANSSPDVIQSTRVHHKQWQCYFDSRTPCPK